MLAVLALLAAACGGSDGAPESPAEPAVTQDAADPDSPDEAQPSEPGPEAPAGPQRPGGEIVLAVEQWPECLNPLTSCANATWLLWSVLVHVQPGLMEFDVNNNIGPSPVLVEAPTVENGGAVLNDDGTLTITYHLNDEARWSDGTPITSTDVWFTWRAKLDTEGSLNTIGYDLITNVDHDDPHTAIISFSEAYAPWRELFGGLDGILPAHAFDGETDISGHWNDSIPISGGPWLQESWSSEQHILVPNENYWVPERMPQVDRVVMVPREDTDTEIVALQTGEVMAAFPQPFPGAKERLAPPLAFVSGAGTFIEGLWINQIAPDRRTSTITRNRTPGLGLRPRPGADRGRGSRTDHRRPGGAAVRGLESRPSATGAPTTSPTTARTWPSRRPRLLTDDGWTRPDPDGLWVNADGVELVLQWNTVAGNKRREDVQALVAEMTRPFGIGWEIINYDPGELFQNRLPVDELRSGGPVRQQHQPGPDGERPVRHRRHSQRGATAIAARTSWPTPARQATDLAFAIDSEIDEAARLKLVRELGSPAGSRRPVDPAVRPAQLARLEPGGPGRAGRMGVQRVRRLLRPVRLDRRRVSQVRRSLGGRLVVRVG